MIWFGSVWVHLGRVCLVWIGLGSSGSGLFGLLDIKYYPAYVCWFFLFLVLSCSCSFDNCCIIFSSASFPARKTLVSRYQLSPFFFHKKKRIIVALLLVLCTYCKFCLGQLFHLVCWNFVGPYYSIWYIYTHSETSIN